MSIKLFGACLIIAGCGGCGYSIAAGAQREAMLLRQLIRILQFMDSELQYRLTPLPELCTLAAREANGVLREVFSALSSALSQQASMDAAGCMELVVRNTPELPGKLRKQLRRLGRSLGRFDLPGQLQGLQAVRQACEMEVEQFRKNREIRLRSYQTLGLCAGAALVILFV